MIVGLCGPFLVEGVMVRQQRRGDTNQYKRSLNRQSLHYDIETRFESVRAGQDIDGQARLYEAAGRNLHELGSRSTLESFRSNGSSWRIHRIEHLILVSISFFASGVTLRRLVAFIGISWSTSHTTLFYVAIDSICPKFSSSSHSLLTLHNQNRGK